MLGGRANLALEYATKRYRSNLINWGMLPLLLKESDAALLDSMQPGDILFLPTIKADITSLTGETAAMIVSANGTVKNLTLALGPLTQDERDIITAGCLMNYYKAQK